MPLFRSWDNAEEHDLRGPTQYEERMLPRSSGAELAWLLLVGRIPSFHLKAQMWSGTSDC